MSSFKEFLTADGQNLFASMTKGYKITFTKIVIGDGIMQAGENEQNMKNVISPRCTLPVESVTKTKDNKVYIRANFKNSDAASFYFREKGVYATIDGKNEYLVFYANNGVYAEWIDKGSSQLIEKIIRTIVSFSSTDKVNITINSSEYALPPIQTDYFTIEEFAKNNEVDVGTEVILPNGDIYIYNGYEYVQIYGAKLFTLMTEATYKPPNKRTKGGLYGLITKKRGLIVLQFDRYVQGLENPRKEKTLYGVETRVKGDVEQSPYSYAGVMKCIIFLDGNNDGVRDPEKLYATIKETR